MVGKHFQENFLRCAMHRDVLGDPSATKPKQPRSNTRKHHRGNGGVRTVVTTNHGVMTTAHCEEHWFEQVTVVERNHRTSTLESSDAPIL